MGTDVIPSTIDEVDAEWLEQAMRKRGIITESRIATLKVEQIGVGVGLMGYLYRVGIEYVEGTPPGPGRVVVKLPVTHEVTRQGARAYRFYEKEVRFYNTLGPETPLRAPAAYAAIHDPESDDFVLVIEDISHLRTADQIAGCCAEDAALAVKALARHHAAFWEDPRFGDPDFAWLPFASDAPTPQVVVQGIQAYWPVFAEVCSDMIDDEVEHLGAWLPGQIEALLTPVPGHPITLVHGDFRLDNLFFHDDGAVSAIDWQICLKGSGGYDIAYFISQSLTSAARRELLDGLVELYLGTLAELGIRYPAEQFWLDFRRGLLFDLVYPIQAASLDLTDPRARGLVREMGSRAITAIVECGTLSLVDR